MAIELSEVVKRLEKGWGSFLSLYGLLYVKVQYCVGVGEVRLLGLSYASSKVMDGWMD